MLVGSEVCSITLKNCKAVYIRLLSWVWMPRSSLDYLHGSEPLPQKMIRLGKQCVPLCRMMYVIFMYRPTRYCSYSHSRVAFVVKGYPTQNIFRKYVPSSNLAINTVGSYPGDIHTHKLSGVPFRGHSPAWVCNLVCRGGGGMVTTNPQATEINTVFVFASHLEKVGFSSTSILEGWGLPWN